MNRKDILNRAFQSGLQANNQYNIPAELIALCNGDSELIRLVVREFERGFDEKLAREDDMF